VSEFIELTSVDDFEPGTMREVDLDEHHLLVARVGD